jgi:hypothetical protein
MAVNVGAQGAEGAIWAYEGGSVSRVVEIE